MGYYIYHKRGTSREEEGYPNKAVADMKKKTKAKRHADVTRTRHHHKMFSKFKVFRDASRSLHVYDALHSLCMLLSRLDVLCACARLRGYPVRPESTV
jgi:hypothetical protein